MILQVSAEGILSDCLTCATKGSKSEIISCFVMLVVGMIIRKVEKKRLLRKTRNETKSDK